MNTKTHLYSFTVMIHLNLTEKQENNDEEFVLFISYFSLVLKMASAFLLQIGKNCNTLSHIAPRLNWTQQKARPFLHNLFLCDENKTRDFLFLFTISVNLPNSSRPLHIFESNIHGNSSTASGLKDAQKIYFTLISKYNIRGY